MTAESPDVLLEMRGIGKSFPGVRALDDVSLRVRRGEIHAVCGENGAGKSTLIKVLAGIYPHGTYEGEIVFDGEECAFRDVRGSEQRGIVVIHQEFALVPHLSIAENLFLGNERARRGVIDWNATLQQSTELMRRVGLDESPTTRVADLGVGKQQLVEIAKALSKRVRLLVLDEPTAALNDQDSRKLLDLVRELRSQGIASIIISHKLAEVTSVADAITVLRDGGTIETLRAGVDEISEDRIIRGMVGRDLEHRFPERTHTVGDVVLEVRDWTVAHPVDHERTVVDGVSLHVRRGEVVGLAGLMGAGRTELAMSMFGRSYGHRVGGQLLKDGREISTRTVSEAVRNGIAYVTEDRKQYGLNLIEDVSRNIVMAALGKVSRRGVVDWAAEHTVAERFRRDLGIKTPSVLTATGTLSGGNQQKVVLSKWMFADPDVLILDEPTRGIDVGAKYEIYAIVNRLVADGKAVVLISSELPELIGMCDRIYTLSQGRLTGEVAGADATQEVLMRQMTAEGVGA
jgi:putative multiple sugar transport system ATP-binding protein